MRHRPLVTLALIGALAQCREPTEITLVLTTDVDCAALRATSIAAARPGQLAGAPALATSRCAPGDKVNALGSIVLSPATDQEALLVVEVKGGVGVDPATCTDHPAACIVARRSLHYIPHKPLTLPIELQGTCLGKVCAADQTCLDGQCVSATIADPNTCASPGGCELDGGAPPDASRPPVPAISSVALGPTHSCAVLATGRIRCWGSNAHGELGTGDLVDSAKAVDVVSPTTQLAAYASVTTGESHTCALDANGAASCWGDDTYGQLGGGTFNTSAAQPTAVAPIPNAAALASIGAGSVQTCALTRTGDVYCWGDNTSGSLGVGGATNQSARPLKVSGLTGVKQLSVGTLHACAVLATGDVVCWGSNTSGQLGTGSQKTAEFVPVTTTPLASAVQVSAGYHHTCAVLSGGTVWCWGGNGFGELGVGPDLGVHTHPTLVGLAEPALAVSAGDRFTCALLASYAVACWGHNGGGETGNGTTVTPQPTAVTPLGIGGALQVVASAAHNSNLLSGHACVLSAAGDRVSCWGTGFDGVLGNGGTADSLTPVDVLGLP